MHRKLTPDKIMPMADTHKLHLLGNYLHDWIKNILYTCLCISITKQVLQNTDSHEGIYEK